MQGRGKNSRAATDVVDKSLGIRTDVDKFHAFGSALIRERGLLIYIMKNDTNVVINLARRCVDTRQQQRRIAIDFRTPDALFHADQTRQRASNGQDLSWLFVQTNRAGYGSGSPYDRVCGCPMNDATHSKQVHAGAWRFLAVAKYVYTGQLTDQIRIQGIAPVGAFGKVTQFKNHC